jgi:pyruvate/2-oxoglutarate dehydrogenase complex dihydrolipoamide acyltransferase (E2) component
VKPTSVSVTLPNLGADRVTFSLWYVRPGDRILEGDRLAEVLIPGATYDIHAPASGTLVEQVVFPNDPLPSNCVLGWIQEE